MKSYIVLIIATLTLLGCKDTTTDVTNYAFFGGEIVNPNNDYVMLYGPKSLADTLYLDRHNRFNIKINNITPGLYSFTHGGEYQMALLEPNDSIMLRLNTADFDESLVFTGHGAKKNNYLIKRFLENENDNKKLNSYYKMEPELFENFIDSTRQKRLKELNLFIEKKTPSELFISIAEASINYNYFANKEIYPFGYFGYNKLIHFKDLPDGFYDFRKEVNYNRNDLSEFYAYNRFLFSHFNNIALERFYSENGHDVPFNRKSLSYNLGKMELIDSLIQSEQIKNYLLKYTARDFIFNSKDKSEINQMLSSYIEKCTDKNHKASIEELVASMNSLNAGKHLPNVQVVNYHGDVFDINAIITKPTVFYFWSSNLKMNYKNSHSKAKQLKDSFPDINFIAINVNDDDNTYWKNTLNKFKFPTAYEYQFKDPNRALNQLVINYVNKVIIVNEDLTIVNSSGNLFSTELEEQLHHLITKHKKTPN